MNHEIFLKNGKKEIGEETKTGRKYSFSMFSYRFDFEPMKLY